MNYLKRVSLAGLLNTCFASGAQAVTVYYQPTPLPPGIPEANFHIRDGWVNNYYPAIKTFQNTEMLKIGGWGDRYLSLLQFDLTGLPKEVSNAYLFLYNLPRNGANPSQVALYSAATKWDTSVTWGNPATSGVLEPYGPPLPGVMPGYAYSIFPGENAFQGMWITQVYKEWMGNWLTPAFPNYGLVIYPNDGNNYQFNYFASSDHPNDGIRPVLRLDFTPSLELKLPFDGTGGKKWRVTTEIGGIRCDGIHEGHMDNNEIVAGVRGTGMYFSLDFSGKAKDANGNIVTNPDSTEGVPILAAGEGKIVAISRQATQGVSGGHYVIIEHGTTGIRTHYFHMQGDPNGSTWSSVPSTRYVGETVYAGTLLGKMGNTGNSFGTHLDFSVKYNGSGHKSQGPLARIVMEGQILKSYQVDKCVGGDSSRYYPSSNVIIP